MEKQTEVWDAALSGEFVQLATDKPKALILTRWNLAEVDKFGQLQYEFSADVIEEDGKGVAKKFTTTSKRLLAKLRPVFEDAAQDDVFPLRIIKVGENFDTQYSVTNLKDSPKITEEKIKEE